MSTAKSVSGLYGLYLGRKVESSASLEFWTGRWGTSISAAEVQEFVTAATTERGSAGLPAITVEGLYQNILGRTADAPGLAHWRSAFGSSIDASEVSAFIEAATPELSARQPLGAVLDTGGGAITLYFDRAFATASNPLASQFTVGGGSSNVAVSAVTVTGNQVTLTLASAIASGQVPLVTYAGSSGNALRTDSGAIAGFTDLPVRAPLSLTPSAATSFAPVSTLALGGAEIAAYDKASSKLFVTSANGLQIVSIGSNLEMRLQKTVLFQTVAGTNDVQSVAASKGVIAAVVKSYASSLPGSLVLLNANGDILKVLEVGANPDMVTFTPDGSKILVANEGELGTSNVVDAVGSVSIVDLSGGVANATVRTAGFDAFNSQAAALRAEGVRLFVGTPGFENRTVAQDLEPEYIGVSPDGRTAYVTLQENNAIGVLDIATATFTRIAPLGLKSFFGLALDASDRDGIGLRKDLPVFGQYMPDAIATFTGADGRVYSVIANEGDDRNDFVTSSETASVGSSSYDLDNTLFPNETALKDVNVLGRLTVTNQTGLRGDTDGDGDIDQILSYGARSFSIVDSTGRIVFDSGSHVEQFITTQGVFSSSSPSTSGAFDDSRSDNKGPEPEGITVGVVNGRTLAFVGLERGGGGVMVYDVTDPASVRFVQYLRNAADVSPEGLLFVPAADSPSGRDLLITSNEVSNSLTTFQNSSAFTLQLLHFSDAEAGLLASSTAPRLAALVDQFEGEFVNSITLAGGDNFIPGPFLAAGTDASIISTLNAVTGSTLAASATVPIGAADISLHNLIGVQASTIGNHEFDLGSRVFRDSFIAGSGYNGAQFPYLSANLDFSGDADLSSRFTDTVATAGLEEASGLKNRIAPSAVITLNGQKIGLVGATTQIIEAIASPSGTEVKGFPTGAGPNGERDDMDLLASQLQPVINDLTNQGVNKIILMAHLQQIANETLLATKLSGVDIILSAGSNTRLGDANDTAVAFAGHAAAFEGGTYPRVLADKDGKTTLLVNTDNEFTYLGRLVVDFDSSGNLISSNLAARSSVNGAYAATDANVAAAWGVSTSQLASTAYAAGTRGGNVKTLSDAVQGVITVKDGNIFGFSNVYLEGERIAVRNQETNLGNLTADSTAAAAKLALGSAVPVVALVNGGGIRAQIGEISPPKADGTVDKLPPAGGVSQLDVENSLRFNNGMMVFDTTADGLKAILEHGVALLGSQGRFPQIGGVAFSYDPTATAGARIRDIALKDGATTINVFNDGVKLSTAPAKIVVASFNFLAQGGDSYPIKANGENFRFLTITGNQVSAGSSVDEALDYSAASVVPSNVLGQQKALELFLKANHATAATAFNVADTPETLDTRIQNIKVRSENVLGGQVTVVGIEDLSFDFLLM